MTDPCNISNYFLRDTKRKLAIPLLQTIVKKIVFLAQFFGIAFLYIDKGQAKSVRVLSANNSSGDLQGTYVKQTKTPSLIRFCDKDKGKVLEVLILKQVIQFQGVFNMVFL